MRVALCTTIGLFILLIVALGPSFGLFHEEELPSLPRSLPVASVTHPLTDLGVVLTLPKNWSITPTMQGALTLHDQYDKLTHVFIQPEGHYYHNPTATSLEDYVSSYRGRDIDVVVDSSEPTEVDGEPALFQRYRAGDLVDGELDSTSLASISGLSYRYVLLHPISKRFLIIAYLGDDDPKILRETVDQLKFIRE